MYDFIPSQSSPKGKRKKKTSVRSKTRHSVKATAKGQQKTASTSSNGSAHKRLRLAQVNEAWGIKHADDIKSELPDQAENEGVLSQATKLKHHIDEIDTNVNLVVEKQEQKKRKHCRFVTGPISHGNDDLTSRQGAKDADKTAKITTDTDHHGDIDHHGQTTPSQRAPNRVAVKIEIPADEECASAVTVTPKFTASSKPGKGDNSTVNNCPS